MTVNDDGAHTAGPWPQAFAIDSAGEVAAGTDRLDPVRSKILDEDPDVAPAIVDGILDAPLSGLPGNEEPKTMVRRVSFDVRP